MAKKRNILIIDDSNTNVVLLEAILSSKGYQPSTALSVKESEELLKKNPPDLILLDLLMPDVSGFDFLRNLRENPDLEKVPVVVVSALTDDITVEKTMSLGAVEFIKKPVNINTLVQTVEETIKRFYSS